jgi:iron complex outermembrane receptor protein
MFIRLLLFLSSFIPFAAFAQVKLSGKVVTIGGEPVSYATVHLLTPDSAIIKSDMTKEDGSFQLIIKPGKYTFQINQFGKLLYKKSLQLYNNTDMGVISVEIVNNLATVVIKGSKQLVKQEFDKLTFDVENSPLKSGYNGLEVLARAPKLQVNAAGEVLLRNATPMIMINGRKQNLSGEELANYLMGLNAEMIKSIEIQTLGSANIDASAKGGVINIILKKAPVGFSSTLTSSYTYRKGNYWSGYTGLNNNYGSDKWNFYSKIGYRKDNDYGSFITRKDFINTGGNNLATGDFTGIRNNMNLLGGIVFYPARKHEFGAEVYYNHGNSNYVTLENLVVRNPDLSSISDNYRTDNSKSKVWYITFNYTFKKDTLGSTVRFIGDIGRNSSTTNNNTNTIYTFGAMPDSQINYLIMPLSDYFTLQADWNQKLNKNWEIKTGLKYGSVKRNNTLETMQWQAPIWVLTKDGQEDFDNHENITAGYFSVSAKLDEKQSFKAGLRVEHTAFSGENPITNQTVKQNYTGFFPSIYYGYATAKDRTLSISFSRNIQRPSFNDLNPFIRKENDYSYITGNPNLKPQYTNLLEFTYQLPKQSLSLYGYTTSDVIAGVYSNDRNITYYTPMNFGNQKQIGLDYSYHDDLTKWLYANISGGPYYYKFKKDNLNPARLALLSNIYTRVKLVKTWSLDITNNLNSRFQNYVVSVAPQYRLDLVLQKTLWAGKGTIKLFWNDVWNTQRDKNFSTYNDFTLNFYQKRRTQAYVLMFVYNFKTKQSIKNKAVQSGNETRGRL